MLWGGEGDDTLIGGSGNDTLEGGAGSDRYEFSAGFGNDTVQLDASGNLDTLVLHGLPRSELTLSRTVTGLLITTSSGDSLKLLGSTGNILLEVLLDDGTRLTQADFLNGLLLVGTSGNDTLKGGSKDDMLLGLQGDDQLLGNDGQDNLDGGDGNDILNGGTGADTLNGGTGNDIYYVDNSGDVVSDASGTERVNSSVSFVLGNGLENLTLTGSANIDGFGNALANALTGNTGNNLLDGGDGNDTLNGGLGADTMNGGAGNDTYYVDNSGDQVIDRDGADRVNSSVSFVLGDGLETLTLTGSASINGTGNALANSLTGNTGNNLLDGGDGNDTLSGGTGDDTLTGGAGRDVMNGGAGSDLFVFNSLTDSGLTSTTRDSISSFVSGVDRLDLSALDADSASAGDQAFSGLISGSQAFTAAGQLKLVAGVLYANTDADAEAEFSVALAGVSTLAMSDFVL